MLEWCRLPAVEDTNDLPITLGLRYTSCGLDFINAIVFLVNRLGLILISKSNTRGGCDDSPGGPPFLFRFFLFFSDFFLLPVILTSASSSSLRGYSSRSGEASTSLVTSSRFVTRVKWDAHLFFCSWLGDATETAGWFLLLLSSARWLSTWLCFKYVS